MIRYLKLPQVVFDETIEQYTPQHLDINVEEINNSAMLKHCILTEEYLRNVTNIYPIYPFKNKKKDKIYDDLSAIEITIVVNTGIINTTIKYIPIAPEDLIIKINEQLSEWDIEDVNDQIEFEENLKQIHASNFLPEIVNNKPLALPTSNKKSK